MPLGALGLVPRGLGVSSISSVSNGRDSGRIKYRMLFPRMLMYSRDIGSRLLIVILTPRRVVFIFGDTERIVPETIVPISSSVRERDHKSRDIDMTYHFSVRFEQTQKSASLKI